MESSYLYKVHNFGIFKKGGKRGILQLDFPSKTLYYIQRGNIKRCYNFNQLQQYDSEEGLQITLHLTDGQLEFDADNTEEKYTICRLLALVVDSHSLEDTSEVVLRNGSTSSSSNGGGPMTISLPLPIQLPQKVFKEGIVEKKGNTTITTWNKRRVRVTSGEFSYYKPGEELALNIVQLWEDVCSVKRSSQSGFSVTVKDRVYSFRLIHDPKYCTELEREEWIKAFRKAAKHKRDTLLYLDSASASSNTVFEFPDDLLNQSPPTPSQQYPPTPSQQPQPQQQQQQQQPQQQQQQQQRPSEPPPLPPHEHRKPVANGKTGGQGVFFLTQADVLGGGEEASSKNASAVGPPEYAAPLAPHHGRTQAPSSPPPPTPTPRGLPPRAPGQSGGKGNGVDPLTGEKQAKSPESIAATRAKLTDLIKRDMQDIAAGLPPLPPRHYKADESTGEAGPMPEPPVDYEEKPKSSSLPRMTSNGHDAEVTSPRPAVAKATVTISNSLPPASPLPPSSPAPPPPLLKAKSSGVKLKVVPKVKTKQLHWMKVPGDLVSSSFWKGARDVTERLDLSQLDEMFPAKESGPPKTPAAEVPGAKKSKQVLLDAKRAQNLGILINAFKDTAMDRLKDSLNSVTELDQFDQEQLTSIKRYQPTADDVEMYRMYRGRQDELCPIDQFMLELCDIPLLPLRLDLVLTVLDFPLQCACLQEEVESLWLACEEARSCATLERVMEYLLAIGNYLNAHITSGVGAPGFQVSSIDRVMDLRGKESKSVLHFLVDQLRRCDPDLLTWPLTLPHVPKCADYSVKAIEAEIEVLKNSLSKIKKHLKTLKSCSSLSTKDDRRFQSDVQNFVTENERRLGALDSRCSQLKEKFARLLVHYGERSNQSCDVFFSSLSHFMERFQAVRDGKAAK